MKRKPPIGSVIEIQLDPSCSFYGQVLESQLVIFNYNKPDLKDLDKIMALNVLFFITIYNSAYRQENWILLGKRDVREDLKYVPLKYIQDMIDPKQFRLYNPNSGEMIPATREECENLECCAVWEANHLEDRLRDNIAGIENIWLKQLKIK